MVVSTDRLNSHIEWVKSIESINYKERGLMKINFPIVSDSELEISKKYGMIHPGSSSTNTVRAVYIINPDDKIRAIFYYPKNIGRNLDEIKRTLIALQYSEKNEVLIPANWNPSDDVLISSPETMDEAEKLEKTNNPDLYSLTWYMWFMKQ
jgi:peroxiredoxin 2/4